MVVLALISDPPVVARILTHLGFAAPALAPAPVCDHPPSGTDGFLADAPFVEVDEPVGEAEPAEGSAMSPGRAMRRGGTLHGRDSTRGVPITTRTPSSKAESADSEENARALGGRRRDEIPYAPMNRGMIPSR